MDSESKAYEAKGWMGYWLRGPEGDRNNNNCFSKIQLIGQKILRPNIFCKLNITNMAGAFRY